MPDQTNAGAAISQQDEIARMRDREAATREILQVVSTSRDDEQPVFETIMENAARLCAAPHAGLLLRSEDDTHLDLVASNTATSRFLDQLRENPHSLETEDSLSARVIRTKETLHVRDVTEAYTDDVADQLKFSVDTEGMRTVVLVPLISGATAIGVIFLYKRVVEPFTDDEIALVETFAAQAVIAIENVRQFREVQERLQREKAMGDVLSVISKSRDDEQPVFDVIVERARVLCKADISGLILGHEGGPPQRAVAQSGVSEQMMNAYRDGHFPMDPELSAGAKAIIERRVVLMEDAAHDEIYHRGGDDRQKAVLRERIRSNLHVPLISDGKGIGCLVLARMEVRPYLPEEIALVETFAAQAVIAIENVRQFRAIQTANSELEARLEREAATREILEVISTSRDDEKPVFDVIIENARRLCEANMAAFVLGEEGGGPQVMVANLGATEETLQLYRDGNFPMDPEVSLAAQAIVTRQTIHLHDMRDTDAYRDGHPNFVSLVDQQGIRTNLLVPLVARGRGIGCLILFRTEARPYSEDQIALVETFAAQAVIAIENVRQFRELQSRLKREQATGEVLSVINRSRSDQQPVFQTILESASRLCDAPLAMFGVVDEARNRMVVDAYLGASAEYIEELNKDGLPLDDPRQAAIRAVTTGEPVQILDMREDELYRAGVRSRTLSVDMEGIRTFLAVPIMAGDRGLGVIVVFRREVRAFDDDQISLLKSFAAQAAIAIENARQFLELQARLEREAATSGILSVISQSPDDESPVFNAIHESVSRLCDAPCSGLFLFDDKHENLNLASHIGINREYVENSAKSWPVTDRSAVVRAAITSKVVHVDDIRDTDAYRSGHIKTLKAVDQEGTRTFLAIPLLSHGRAIGSIGIYRREVRPFTEDEINLARTFAAQAVIAIENVRQFRELQTRLEREEASREILGVISESRDDELPVFDAILKNASTLCNAPFAALILGRKGDAFQTLAANIGDSVETIEMYHAQRVPMDPGMSYAAQAIHECRVIHLQNLGATDYYRDGSPPIRALVDGEGVATVLFVPLVAGGEAIGVITLFRREVDPFDQRNIDLVETFAEQAVIAIENSRQFKALVDARDAAEAALADLKKAQERLIQSEKMASLGQLTAGIAHEIKNPLNFVNNFAKLSDELLAELGEILEDQIKSLEDEDRDDAEDLFQTVRENLGKINQHGRRADSIIKNMLLHSREGPSERQRRALNPIIEEALNLAYHGARAENSSFNIDMQTDLAEDAGEIECYPQDLMRVFLNLISNGMYAAHKRSLTQEGFAPVISVTSRVNGDRIEVEVRDNGMGIPDDLREKIFTPFFTTKPAGEGTGLGLSLSYDIVVKQHGGDLTVDSEPGQFTVFRTSFPRTLPASIGGET